jgi:hypothetical protein
MKKLVLHLLFLSLLSFNSNAQIENWIDKTPYFESYVQYAVDGKGKVYAVVTEYRGDNYYLVVSQLDPFTNNWVEIYSEVVAQPGTQIALDAHEGIIYFSFFSDESTRTLDLYKIQNETVLPIINGKNINEYYVSSAFDFKVGNQPNEYFWLMERDLGDGFTEPMLVTYNGSYLFDTLPTTYFNQNNLQLELVGDTVWIGFTDFSDDKLKLFKTHKSSIDFQSADTDPDGFIVDASPNFISGNSYFLVSDKNSKITIVSTELSSNTRIDVTFTNGVKSFPDFFPDFFSNYGTRISSSDGNGFILTTFAEDFENTGQNETKVFKKDFTSETWSVLGDNSQIFSSQNAIFDHVAAYDYISNRFIAKFFDVNSSVEFLKVSNQAPDVSSVIVENTSPFCSGDVNYNPIFSEFSILDDNYDELELYYVSSSDPSVIDENFISFSFVEKVGKKNYFDIQVSDANPGTTDLTIFLTDGYDTVYVIQTVDVIFENTIDLFSSIGTDNQTVCVNQFLDDIVYVTNGASGATFLNLPDGVFGSWDEDTVRIYGTPSTPGFYTYQIDLTGGCGIVNITGDINVLSLPLTPIIGAITQPTCALNTGEVELLDLPSANWILYPGSIVGFGSTYILSNLTENSSYNFSVVDDFGCSSDQSSIVNINPTPTPPTVPTVASTTQPTCDIPSGTIVFNPQADVEYSVDNGTSYQAGTTFPGLAPATYTLRVRSTTDNTCSTPAAATVTINAVPNAPDSAYSSKYHSTNL